MSAFQLPARPQAPPGEPERIAGPRLTAVVTGPLSLRGTIARGSRRASDDATRAVARARSLLATRRLLLEERRELCAERRELLEQRFRQGTTGLGARLR